MSLWFTTLTLYLSEGGLTFLFFAGMWAASGWLVRVLRRGPVRLDRVTDAMMRRVAIWLTVFIAVWSVLFKGVLYVTLRRSTAHVLLSKGQSLGIAVPAECVLLLLLLVGLAWSLLAIRDKAAAAAARSVDVTP